MCNTANPNTEGSSSAGSSPGVQMTNECKGADLCLGVPYEEEGCKSFYTINPSGSGSSG